MNVPWLLKCDFLLQFITTAELTICVAVGEDGTPSIRPLETLHNALSLRQVDTFLEQITNANYKTPTLREGLGNKGSANIPGIPGIIEK